jgi:hypothetical protein
VYRRLISALGDGAQALRAQLWRALGDLYDTRLRDQENARTAYEMAARLAPNDVTAQRKVIELNGQDPARWRESARALAAEWQQTPGDAELGQRLVEPLPQGRPPRRGHGDGGGARPARRGRRRCAKLAEQGRPRLLRRVAGPLEQSVLRKIAAAGEDEDVEAMMDALARAGVLEASQAGDAGPALAPDQLPAAFRRVLGYACEALRIDEPPAVVPAPGLDRRARMIDVRPPRLLAGTGSSSRRTPWSSGTGLTRALSCASAGRVRARCARARHLRPYFVAALTLARGAANSPTPRCSRSSTRCSWAARRCGAC